MAISARQASDRRAFQRLVARLIEQGCLPDADLARLVQGLFKGDHWVSFQTYRQMQQRLATATAPAGAQRLAAALQRRPYQDYLTAVRARRAAQALPIAYQRHHIPTTTPNNRRPGGVMSPLYLTIHSTGNPASKAAGERAWLTHAQNNRTASYHVVVDETQAVECIPLHEPAWHAGDGQGDGNRKSIGLEICESGDRGQTLRHAVVLAAKILRDRGLDASRLRRHRDWAPKMCPRILIVPENRQSPAHTWAWFTAEVEALL